jgi:hypothetical protein
MADALPPLSPLSPLSHETLRSVGSGAGLDKIAELGFGLFESPL